MSIKEFNVKKWIRRDLRSSYINSGVPSLDDLVSKGLKSKTRHALVMEKLQSLTAGAMKHISSADIESCISSTQHSESGFQKRVNQLIRSGIVRERRERFVEQKLSQISSTVRSRIREQTLNQFIRYGAAVSQGEYQYMTSFDRIIEKASRQHSLV
mmetsp:Transcript_2966/g.3512  ORF Transcript_2966/g.3512 Transcript_2966/m.3512 type:complete len:156 (+) Transcript_2966:3-470(+)